MTALTTLLTDNDVYLGIPVADESALIELAAVLLSARCGIPRQDLASQLSARERMGSTALGQEVAIPHARMRVCTQSAGVLIRVDRPIAFAAPDGRLVGLFACFVFPNRASNEPMRLLADAATIFSDFALREQLMRCTDPASFLALLRARDR